ncbi:6-phosphogluconate dehydrogenase C-terminal domain-like protein [Xylariaceae sp. FL0804]|nr:6-phosphogluconate dehydrogenase C-terminal domain-like protein [Xylariaceae sp. FL0804]
MASSTATLAKIGIISIGDMGVGIAKLLIAHGFSVASNCQGRSEYTISRARSAGVELLTSDEALASQCAVILSVVPPRDATATARRVVDAVTGPVRRDGDSDGPLYFADLNAVAPSTARGMAAEIEKSRAPIRFVDGAILGGPPSAPADDSGSGSGSGSGGDWKRPSIPMSGPHRLADIPAYGARLASVLNVKHNSADIGSASGLKMCFASMSKGLTALAIQSFTTAHRLGVLDQLRSEMQERLPHHWRLGAGGAVAMAPKAYRWVREMDEIALTFAEEGGLPPDTFAGVAKVYRAVAEDTALGAERIGARKRGLDVDDMAAAMAEGLDKKRKKED